MEYDHQWLSTGKNGHEAIHRITLQKKVVRVEVHGEWGWNDPWLTILHMSFNTVGEAAAFAATLINNTL